MKKIQNSSFLFFSHLVVINSNYKTKWIFIIFLLFFKISFSQNNANEIKIIVPEFKGSAKELLDKISREEKIVFAWSSEISLNFEVDFKCEKLTIKEFMEIILKGKQIGYKVNGNKILLFPDNLKTENEEKITLINLKAIVKDSLTREPLGFCNIALKGTKKGAITNIDGVFNIMADVSKDVLLISYIGYEKKEIQASGLLTKHEIYLRKKEVVLKEVVIHSNDDYLYDMMDKCRNKLKGNKAERTAKVYFGLETRLKVLSGEYSTDSNWSVIEFDSIQLHEEKPVELLECLYNAQLKGSKVDALDFKNGRMALASNDNYFLNMGSSTAFSELSLTKDNGMYPVVPFQFSKRALTKNYNLELAYYDGKIYNITFEPGKNNKNAFRGEVWIDANNYNLLKINLKAENSKVHPFLPNFDRDTIRNVSFDITNTYKSDEELSFPDHFIFNYSITYLSRKDSAFLKLKRLNSVVKSKSIMYFYDYDKPFILPYFEYTDNLFGRDDSYKISFIPYNETLWNSENIVLQSEKQKQEYGLLSNKGELTNYRNGNYSTGFLANLTGRDTLPGHFQFFYPYWSSQKRVIPSFNGENFNTYSKEKINSSIRTDLYKLKVQILLDITESGDSLLCKSYTVFDTEQTYYHLPLNFYSNAFLNIYFDIWEIERRKMQQKLEVGNFNLSQINEIYNTTIENLNTISEKYCKEVNVGENEKMLKKWNDYVLEKLEIDNMKMVENSVKETDK